MSKTEVLCIGLSCVDVLIKNTDLTTPFTGEAKAAEHVSLGIGGDAANEAVTLSKLGHSVRLMTGLGGDDTGRYIMGCLENSGVSCSGSSIVPDGDSPVNVIVIQKNGDRNFINSGTPKAADFEPRVSEIRDVEVVSFASLFMPPFTTCEHLLDAAKRAKEIGAATCLDVIVGVDARLEDYREALGYIDYVFPNEEEAAALTGKKDLYGMAGAFLDYGIGNVIIKTGKDGCYVRNREGDFRVPGYQVPHVTDTTGAGDNFAAGFISGLLQGKNLRECCRYACGVAGVAIQYQGACTGVRSREQVEDEIKKMEAGKD